MKLGTGNANFVRMEKLQRNNGQCTWLQCDKQKATVQERAKTRKGKAEKEEIATTCC